MSGLVIGLPLIEDIGNWKKERISIATGQKGRLMGLDVGESRIGVAFSDPGRMLAFPFKAIPRSMDENDLLAIGTLASERDVKLIVVGIPTSLDGNLHYQGLQIAGFLEVLRSSTSIPVEPWGEQFTTAEAERLLSESGVKPSLDRGRLDAAAAAVILQDYLDSTREWQ